MASHPEALPRKSGGNRHAFIGDSSVFDGDAHENHFVRRFPEGVSVEDISRRSLNSDL